MTCLAQLAHCGLFEEKKILNVYYIMTKMMFLLKRKNIQMEVE